MRDMMRWPPLSVLSAAKTHSQVLKIGSETVHIVSVVIRYYDNAGGWRTIDSQEGGHPIINVSSITSDDRSITIHFDSSGWGNAKPSSAIAVVDEDLAREGVFVGASVGSAKAVLDLSVA